MPPPGRRRTRLPETPLTPTTSKPSGRRRSFGFAICRKYAPASPADPLPRRRSSSCIDALADFRHSQPATPVPRQLPALALQVSIASDRGLTRRISGKAKSSGGRVSRLSSRMRLDRGTYSKHRRLLVYPRSIRRSPRLEVDPPLTRCRKRAYIIFGARLTDTPRPAWDDALENFSHEQREAMGVGS
jgi:hypothetical protein